jgi:hypothetical protein
LNSVSPHSTTLDFSLKLRSSSIIAWKIIWRAEQITEDLKELLDYGEWNKYTNVSFGDWLRKASVSDQFITEQLDPILRVIYEQNEGINGKSYYHINIP